MHNLLVSFTRVHLRPTRATVFLASLDSRSIPEVFRRSLYEVCTCHALRINFMHATGHLLGASATDQRRVNKFGIDVLSFLFSALSANLLHRHPSS